MELSANFISISTEMRGPHIIAEIFYILIEYKEIYIEIMQEM